MPEFHYTAIDANGRKCKGKLTANDTSEVFQTLKVQQKFCLSVKEIKKTNAVSVSSKKLSLKELTLFFRQLHTMLKSGVSIVNTLHILYAQMEKPKTKALIFKIYERVQTGQSLASSMEQLGDTFPSFSIHMIRSGEASGSLDDVTGKLASYYEKTQKMRVKLIQALIYPTFLLIVMVAVVILLMVKVVPDIVGQFTMLDAELPATTRTLIGISDFLTNSWYILLFLALVIVAVASHLLKMKEVRIEFDRLKLSIPIVGKLYNTIICSKMCRCLYFLLSGGVPLISAIEMTTGVIGNQYVASKLWRVKEEVSKGKQLSKALEETGLFPVMLISMLAVGEESGTLDHMIEKTSEIYDEAADTALARMVSLVEPIIIVFMGIVVAFVIISIIQPIYGINDYIQ